MIQKTLSAVVFILSFILMSCGSKPEPQAVSDKLFSNAIVQKAGGQGALWLAGSDYQSMGVLGRYDLSTNRINSRVRAIGPDVKIIADPQHSNEMFLLTRRTKDSIQIVQGPQAQLKKQISLPEKINPQDVERDALGRVWVVSQDSNLVTVYDENLDQVVKTIDISFFKDSDDEFAELSQVLPVSKDLVLVVAQRLHRKNVGTNDGHWIPDQKSGVTLINPQTFDISDTEYLPVPNPTHAYLVGAGTAESPSRFLFVGAGDTGDKVTPQGTKSTFTLDFKGETTQQSYLYSMIGSALTADQKLVTINWDPAHVGGSQTCISFEDRNLTCQADYAFGDVAVLGQVAFVSYVQGLNSELWAIPLDGSPIERAFTGMLPVLSLSAGP